MSGNRFGQRFCVSTFGESHGAAIGCVVDGMPAGIPLVIEDIQSHLDKRKPGQQGTTPRSEPDLAKILSGVFEGRTLGTPICIVIPNTNVKSEDYRDLTHVYRPGHGDYTYQKKYGHRDWRGGGRGSARETAARVAAGALAQCFLRAKGISIYPYLAQVGHIEIPFTDTVIKSAAQNPYYCPDVSSISPIQALMSDLAIAGDSVGARINLAIYGCPIGLGQPVFDKLEADLAKAMLSIPAVKGIEFGAGFAAVMQKGSEHRDPISSNGFVTNQGGGTLAGISTGQPITLSIALKPTSSIAQPIHTIDHQNQPVEVTVKGRHDPCVGLRAAPIAQAMAAMVLADHWLVRYGESHFTEESWT